MDPSRFDHLVRSLDTTPSRRQILRLLGGAAAAALAALAGTRGADARRRGRRRRVAAAAIGEGGGGGGTDGGGEQLPDGSPVARRNQQSFVTSCRANGGTSSRVDTYVARCCYPASPGHAAWCDTCNFNYDPPACSQTFLHPAGGVPVVPGGGTYAEAP